MVTTEAALNHSEYGTDDRFHRLGEFTSYREAEHMVDRLSDAGFPVARVRTVDTRMHSVEQRTGRLAKVRATLIGAGLGAWLGLVTGLVTGLPLALSGAGLVWLTAMLGGPLIGAVFGAALGFITYWATDGRRDSVSTTDLRARRYAVEIDSARATEDVKALDRSRLTVGWGHHPVRYQLGYVRRRSGQDRGSSPTLSSVQAHAAKDGI
jgi:mRNA-degrading endonuclease toxin of MazEF toxin-antitoxin module